MAIYGAFEAKNKFSELLDRALRGEEVIVSRRGKPEVKIVPVHADAGETKRKESALKNLRETRKLLKKHGVSFSTEEILAAKNEGHR